MSHLCVCQSRCVRVIDCFMNEDIRTQWKMNQKDRNTYTQRNHLLHRYLAPLNFHKNVRINTRVRHFEMLCCFLIFQWSKQTILLFYFSLGYLTADFQFVILFGMKDRCKFNDGIRETKRQFCTYCKNLVYQVKRISAYNVVQSAPVEKQHCNNNIYDAHAIKKG